MVTGPPGVIVPAGWLVETAAGIQFFAVSDTEIGAEGTVMVPFRCTSTGPDGNVAADTITTITNPGSVAGITAVTNPAALLAVENGKRMKNSATATMPAWTMPRRECGQHPCRPAPEC